MKDVVLPGVSGAELGWQIRPRMPTLPLVALCSRPRTRDEDDLIDLGFNRVLLRHPDYEHLARCCRELHDGKQLPRPASAYAS